MAPIMKTASMKPEVALLDNDELNGVDNEADDWQVNNFQILDKIWHFWRFVYFFGTFLQFFGRWCSGGSVGRTNALIHKGLRIFP